MQYEYDIFVITEVRDDYRVGQYQNIHVTIYHESNYHDNRYYHNIILANQ